MELNLFYLKYLRIREKLKTEMEWKSLKKIFGEEFV